MRARQGLERFVKKNGSTILTCVGAAGVVGTSILTVRSATKANDILAKAEKEKGEELTVLEKVNYAFPTYIPPILMGVGTIACIFGANVLNKKHQASLISAYGMLDQSYKEYRNKVKELYGEEAEQAVEESIAEDHVKPRRRPR